MEKSLKKSEKTRTNNHGFYRFARNMRANIPGRTKNERRWGAFRHVRSGGLLPEGHHEKHKELRPPSHEASIFAKATTDKTAGLVDLRGVKINRYRTGGSTGGGKKRREIAGENEGEI